MKVEIPLDAVRSKAHLTSMNIETAAQQLDALGKPTRLRIYRTLVRAGTAGISVGTLQERMQMPASTLSHHLKRLVETSLVSQERIATTLICRAEYPAMRSLIGYLADECCADEHTDARQGAEAS